MSKVRKIKKNWILPRIKRCVSLLISIGLGILLAFLRGRSTDSVIGTSLLSNSPSDSSFDEPFPLWKKLVRIKLWLKFEIALFSRLQLLCLQLIEMLLKFSFYFWRFFSMLLGLLNFFLHSKLCKILFDTFLHVFCFVFREKKIGWRPVIV